MSSVPTALTALLSLVSPADTTRRAADSAAVRQAVVAHFQVPDTAVSAVRFLGDTAWARVGGVRDVTKTVRVERRRSWWTFVRVETIAVTLP